MQDELVSEANPNGTITNSDLELAATIVHEAAISTVVDLIAHSERVEQWLSCVVASTAQSFN